MSEVDLTTRKAEPVTTTSCKMKWSLGEHLGNISLEITPDFPYYPNVSPCVLDLG